MYWLAVFGASALAARAASAPEPTVTIDAGAVRGGICDDNYGAAYFKSIPFADPPVKDLRYAAPKAYSRKFPEGGIDATKPAPSCIQFGTQFAETGLDTAEDCLYLDVWAPFNATKDSGLPVRVWLYGGGNADGSISDPLYDGCPVPSTGAIMVSINYRLGPLGFFKGAGFDGNQGIQDALLGLQWVQDNIQAFGGDPKKVVLHGESAGAIDSFAIATLEQAPKLFSSAIFQSGGGLPASTTGAVENISTTFAQGLQCGDTDQKSVKELKDAYGKLSIDGNANSPSAPNFAPCVDGKIIPVQPADQSVRVPSIFGSNLEEGTLLTLAQYMSDPSAAKPSAYDAYLKRNFGDRADDIKKQYPYEAYKDTPFPPIYAISQIVTDTVFRCPARRGLMQAAQNGVPVWTYLFAQKPKCSWEQQIPDLGVPLLGATHTAEIPFVLGHTNTLPLPNGTCEMSDTEKDISAFLTKAWTAMAKDQTPGDNHTWPQWTSAQSAGVTLLNGTTVGLINYTQCDLWDEINKEMQSSNSTGGASIGGSSTNSGGSGSGSPTSSPGSGSTGTSAASVRLVNVALVLGWCAALTMLLG